MNDCNIIFSYRVGSYWVFDDARHGLKQEPFVGDTNLVIDELVAAKDLKGKRFSLLFSQVPFPKYDAFFTLERKEGKSAWYWYDKLQISFWLCPSIRHYFAEIPKKSLSKSS